MRSFAALSAAQDDSLYRRWERAMTGWVLALIVVGALIGALVYVLGSKDRYEEMTEEEFEEEVKKKSLLGAAITGLEGTLRKREATIMMEAKSRVERDATPSPGDRPDEEAAKEGDCTGGGKR